MRIGYLSDEFYVAVADAPIEIVTDDGTIVQTYSSATGVIEADVEPGPLVIKIGRAHV